MNRHTSPRRPAPDRAPRPAPSAIGRQAARRLVVTLLLCFGLAIAASPASAGPAASAPAHRPSHAAHAVPDAAPPHTGPLRAVARQGTAPAPPAALDGWVRAGMKGMNSAAYLTLQSSGEDDVLVGATSELADATEVHRSFMDGSVMRMEPAGPLAIPAGGSVELAPGGYHIMLIGLRDDLAEGTEARLTLQFGRAGELPLSLPVRPLGGMRAH